MDAPSRRGGAGWRWGFVATGLVVGSLAAFVAARATTDRFLRATAHDVCERSSLDLVRAAGAGDVEMVHLELDDGRDPNERDDDGNTALGCAIPRHRREVVGALLERGADPNASSGAGRYADLPIELAYERRELQTVRALLDRGGDPDRVSEASFTLGEQSEEPVDEVPVLVQAIRNHDDTAVDLLLAAGADPDHQGDVVPLHLAIQDGSDASVARLLAAGAGPNGEVDQRPLVAATTTGERATTVSLLALGPDLTLPAEADALATVGGRALGGAAGSGDLAAVTTLLDAGVDPDEDPFLSPLLRATALGDTEIARVLLDAGADPDAGEADEVAAAIVLDAGLVEALRTWTDRGANTDAGDPLGATVVTEPFRRFSMSPLATAVATGDLAMVGLLLDRGADPNQVAWDRFAPIDLAGLTCDVVTAQRLLDAGATSHLAVPPPGASGACDDVRNLIGG